MSRRKLRRSRLKPEPAQAPVVPERPVNWPRLRQIFGNMSHRGTKIFPNHVLSPVVVDARTPEEAALLTELALVEETKNGQEN